MSIYLHKPSGQFFGIFSSSSLGRWLMADPAAPMFTRLCENCLQDGETPWALWKVDPAASSVFLSIAAPSGSRKKRFVWGYCLIQGLVLTLENGLIRNAVNILFTSMLAVLLNTFDLRQFCYSVLIQIQLVWQDRSVQTDLLDDGYHCGLEESAQNLLCWRISSWLQ